MENLKQLFTDADFELLNKAIDSLPKVGFSTMMMTEMLFMGIGRENPEQRERERNERIEKMKKEDQKVEDQCLELKFKILQLKKSLQ